MLPFDPIDEAARQWALRWGAVPQMHAVTSLMRVQQLVINRLDSILKPHGLTFARYEALVLLTFSSAGSLPLGPDGLSVRERARGVRFVAEQEDVELGEHDRLSATLSPGRYVVFCNLEGHYLAGMRASFRVVR